MKKYTDQMVEQISKAPEQAGGHKDKPQVRALKRNLPLVQIEKYDDAERFTDHIRSRRGEQEVGVGLIGGARRGGSQGSGGFGGKARVWPFRILPDWDKAKEDKRYDVKSRTSIHGSCYQILHKSYLLFT